MSTGKLFVVGTPIGNMEDITLRALRVLREVDMIAAEDTRHTGMLLAKHSIHKPLISYHDFNEAKRTAELLGKFKEGLNLALVSDAGMPTLSDPGLRLVRAAVEAGVAVDVIPGVSAITTAMALSGLPPEPFLFHGFLPHKSGQRRNVLTKLLPLPWTLVFFESPYRLIKTLVDIQVVFGNRKIVVARELTKKFEEIIRGDVEAVLKRLEPRTIKGEITLVVEGNSACK